MAGGPYSIIDSQQTIGNQPNPIATTTNGTKVYDSSDRGTFSKTHPDLEYCGVIRQIVYDTSLTLSAEFRDKNNGSTGYYNSQELAASDHPEAPRAKKELEDAFASVRKNGDSIFQYPNASEDQSSCPKPVAGLKMPKKSFS